MYRNDEEFDYLALKEGLVREKVFLADQERKRDGRQN
jgi:hypothetical protein